MQEHRPRHRVRKIIDPSKYRRHRRKKLLQTAGVLAGWIVLIAICCFFIWLVLTWLTQLPEPQ
jgi:hypothetical protein